MVEPVFIDNYKFYIQTTLLVRRFNPLLSIDLTDVKLLYKNGQLYFYLFN